MINNKTQQKPVTTTTTKVSESSVYLKKSELPKDVSSFRNDAGYITSSSLGIWLKEHSYIPKNEINTLISRVDISNKSIDNTTVLTHTSQIGEIKGDRQEYWSGLLWPPPGDLPDPGMEPVSPVSPALAGEFFTISVI